METPITCHARYLDQAIWSKTLRQYLLQKTNLNQDSLILEVGCGTGAVLQSLASEMGEHCIGLDFSLPDIQFLHHNHPDLSVVAGNAYALPLKDNTLDAIVCHFLLLWLEDPLSALREMLRVTRPGGWIMVFAEPDYGGRIDHPEILAEPGALQAQSLREQGANPQSGRNLPDWFEQLGLVEISCGVMGSEWQIKPASAENSTEQATLQQDLAGWVSPSTLHTWQQADRESYTRGTRVLYVPTFWAIGKKAA